jgi:hypothetical protein
MATAMVQATYKGELVDTLTIDWKRQGYSSLPLPIFGASYSGYSCLISDFKGKAPNLIVEDTYKTTINANGVITVERTSSKVKCK